jgi:hypothetical protein
MENKVVQRKQVMACCCGGTCLMSIMDIEVAMTRALDPAEYAACSELPIAHPGLHKLARWVYRSPHP